MIITDMSVGMSVKCIESYDHGTMSVHEGEVYTISKIRSDNCVDLLEIGQFGFSPYRFKPNNDTELRYKL